MRYIIECDDPTDIILGMKCIKSLIETKSKDSIMCFKGDDRLWWVKKTKTGYSARTFTE